MRKSEIRRELIERTALRLFAERGYAEVSTRDIAAACDIGESALYRHMQSKEELAVRVFREAYTGFGIAMKMACAPDAKLKDKLSAYLTVMLNAHDADSVLVRFLLVHQHDVLKKAITYEDITPVTVVVEAIHKAILGGEIRAANSALLSSMVMGAAIQPLVFMSYGRISEPAIEHHSEILKAICGLVGLEAGDMK